MRLQHKRALVTGAASGIGRAIALRFAQEGAAVGIADLDHSGAVAAAKEVTDAGSTALPVQVDVTDERQVAAMVARVEDEFGRVDVLVNNAVQMPSDDLLAMSPDEWDRDVEISLGGPYLCVHSVLPGMLERGSGTVLNIVSVNALGFYGNEAYSAAKAGLISLTRSIAVRYGAKGIRANAIAPGTVRTPAWGRRLEVEPQVLDRVATWYPLQRVGEVDDIANAALFLVSDEASWITGVVLPVDGGLTAGNYRMTAELLPESDL